MTLFRRNVIAVKNINKIVGRALMPDLIYLIQDQLTRKTLRQFILK